MFRITEYEMSDGDMVDYERALAAIAAMQTIMRRHPWRAKALRAMAHFETEKLARITSRYSHVEA